MPLRREGKKCIVEQVSKVASASVSAGVSDSSKLSAPEMAIFREAARKEGIFVKVVRNTLAKRAIEDTDFNCLTDYLFGPSLLAFSEEDPGAVARLFKNFAKENKNLKVKALSVSGELFQANQVDQLANIPTIDKARSMLMSVLLAPVTKLATTINAVPGKLVRTVAAVAEDKKKAS